MANSDWIVLLAAITCAAAVLPGTLGILMLTNRLAAEARGARLIYQHSRILLMASAAGLVLAWVIAIQDDAVSGPLLAGTILYAGVLGFGFLMHTRLLFRPIRRPTFISVAQALERFDAAEEVVGILDPKGDPYAFIARLARRPHVVHQPDGQAPFTMTHCILSHSSMAYENSGAFDKPDIMVTAAIANNMVFYDAKNRCSITQLHNASRDGSLPLKTLPSLMMRLATWAELYPDSRIWVRAKTWRDAFYLKVLSRADVIDPESPVLIYPLMNPSDERLPLKSQVLGVEIAGAERAYPLAALNDGQPLNDELGGVPILIVSAFDNDYAQIFIRQLKDGTTLNFRLSGESGTLTDTETGSSWDLKGHCKAGPRSGDSLQPVPHYNKIFWFAWADYHPNTEICLPRDSARDQAA
ncbi:MAG: DUF3179 domain-containing protein [Woeseiaceae bacterium]|nr:DUF3179 domain-containing protein [Woeseiaceae bacterium]